MYRLGLDKILNFNTSLYVIISFLYLLPDIEYICNTSHKVSNTLFSHNFMQINTDQLLIYWWWTYEQQYNSINAQ